MATKKKKGSFTNSTTTEKTTKTGQSASVGTSSQKSKSTGTQTSSGASGNAFVDAVRNRTGSTQSSSGSSSRSSFGTSSGNTGSTDTSARRTSTVTVPTVSAQNGKQETEQERNKWREIANWLTSPISAAVGGGNRNTWLSDVALSAGKNLAGSYAGAAAVGAETLSRGMDYEGLENIERQQREEEAARITNERDAYVEASVDRGEKPDEQILAWYDQQLTDLHLDTVSEEIDAAEQSGREKRQHLYDTSALLMQEAGEHKQAAADTLNRNPVLGWTPMNNRIGETLGIADMTIGDVLTDSSTAGLEMLSDAALGAATGGGSMFPMLVRSFGAGASETAQNGGDVREQLWQGTKQAATEWVTEHIFGGNPVYDKGKGIVDNAAEKALTRVLGADRFNSLISSAAARVMKVPAGMLEEGLEEAIGDYLNPLADSVRNAARGEGWSYDAPEIGDVSREFLTGALLGGMGQVSSVIGNRGGNAQTQETTPAAAQRTGIDADISNIVDTALGVKPAENGDVEAIAQHAVDNAVAETAPVEEQAAEPAAPMTLEEREADGQTSAARGEPENHIDNRSFSEVGNRRIKAFQFDHPELHQYYVPVAEVLARDADISAGSVIRSSTRSGYSTHVDNSPLTARAKELGLSMKEVMDACQAIINDNGQENYAAAKKVEMILDEMLSNGYKSFETGSSFGAGIPANQEYIAAKSRIAGSRDAANAERRAGMNEWQKFLDDDGNDFLLALGEITEDELAQEFIAEHPDLAWQVTGEPDPATLAQQTTEETAGAADDYIHAEHHGNILDGIRAHIDEVDTMESVSSITGQEFQKTASDARTLRQKVTDFFNSLGNVVHRKGFGDIALNNAGVHDSLGHGYGKLKAATFACLPEVLSDGRIISFDPNFEGRGYKSFLIAAPVEVGGERCYVGAYVIQDANTQRYKVHEVLTTNKDGTQSFKTETLDNEGDLRDHVPSDNSVPQNDAAVNGETFQLGTRPTMPEPTLPQVPDGRSGVNWENRFQTVQATPMPEGMRQSKSYETVKNAEPTSEAMQSIMDTEGFQSIARYAATTNQADVDNAIAYLRKNGYTASMDSFIKDANAGNSGAELVARGALLLKAASDMGRMRDFADLYVAYKTIGTKAGQTTQAFKIYQKLLNMVDGYALNMTPQDKVYLMRKSVAEYNAEIPNKKHLTAGQRGIRLELDEGLVQQFLNAQTEEQRAEIQPASLDDLGQQAPSSWVEKLNSWRYFSMLFNPRTHIRNVASNFLSQPVVLVKDKVAQAMEHFLISDSSERTKATLDLRNNSQDRINMAYASQFYNNFLRDDAGSKWFDENGKNEIDRNKTIFKRNKPLEWLNDKNSGLLDREDIWFSRPAFSIAFARECKLQGITAEDIETGRADAGTVQGMVERAQRYSQEMVFRESSKLATWLSKQVNSGGAWGTIVDATLPFKRTPANILTRGWQYSPMGLIQGVAQYKTKVESGEMTAAQAIDNIAKGVTGTGLMTLGYFLAKTGALTGGGSDDDKQDAFDTLRGRQDFSFKFKFFDHYISAENFGFEAVPLLVGASLYERVANSAYDWDETTTTGDKVLDFIEQVPKVLRGMTQPVMETTMLSTLNNMFTDLQYAKDDPVGTVIMSLINNYINQFFPTIGGAAERTFLENRRESTFTDRTGGGSFDVFGQNVDASDSILGRFEGMQYETGYKLNRIPGVEYNQIPYLDAWGREQETGGLLERFINNFLNPANMSERRDTGVEDELQRLYDAGFDGVFPERPAQSVKVNQHNLTADEYVTYAQTLGQESLAGLESLMSSDDWSKASDEEKAKQIEAVYKMAKDAAETAVDPASAEKDESITKNKAAIQKAYGFDDAQYTAAYTKYGSEFLTNKTTQTMYDAGVDLGDYYALDQSMKALPKAGQSVLGWQKMISVSYSDMTDKQKETFYKSVMAEGTYKKWQDAKKSGVTMQEFCSGQYDGYKGYESYQSGSQYYVGKTNGTSKSTSSTSTSTARSTKSKKAETEPEEEDDSVGWLARLFSGTRAG